MPDVAGKLKALGVMPGGGTPEDFLQRLKTDSAIYHHIAQSSNIRVTQQAPGMRVWRRLDQAFDCLGSNSLQ